MSEGMSEYYFDYNDRYGVKNQRAWIPTAIVLAIIFGGWLLWSSNYHARPAISSQLISFDNGDPRKISVRYSITRRDETHPATCTLVARNFEKIVVGQIDDHITAREGRYVEHTVTIPSRDDAVNAAVISCRLD